MTGKGTDANNLKPNKGMRWVTSTTLVLFYPWERPGVQCGRGWGGVQELVWTAWKVLPPAGLYPWTVQPIAIPYTDKTIQTVILASTKTLFSQPEEGSACFSET